MNFFNFFLIKKTVFEKKIKAVTLQLLVQASEKFLGVM